MSVSNKAKRRGTILDEIMRYQRDKLPEVMRQVPLEDLRAFASVAPEPNDFEAALKAPGVSLIAECKKASPSKGLIAPEYEAWRLAKSYIEAGASAISVLTNGRYFQGSLEDLRDVKELIEGGISAKPKTLKGQLKIPVLRKDFIFHPYQIYEARVAGADAVLLITAVLEGGEIRDLAQLADELGMSALIEVHDEAELLRALESGARIIGINNRNLQTFDVDLNNTARLREKIPSGIITVSESGIKTPSDIRRMKELDVDAVLVGTSLVQSKDISAQVKALVDAGKYA
ncbi:MAG: indole-3-glycerol phosphate synthase TrpC [Candidatus Promineifilaceae bacterium]